MTYDHLPTWVTHRCADCGELFLPGFGSSWSSRRPDVHTHGGLNRCRAQAEHLTKHPDSLAMQLTLMQQAIVEARQILGQFVCEADDTDWTEDVARTVFAAQHALDRGYDARKLIEFAPVAASEGVEG